MERKPILTRANKRNSDINPEFMDINAMLIRFEPLMRKLYYKYVKFDTFYCKADMQELKDEITAIVVHLYHKWNPKIGVDFTGFLNQQLNDRVYAWVKKRQDTRKGEVLTSFQEQDEDDDSLAYTELSEDLEDRPQNQPYSWIDTCQSCPWEILDETETAICQKVLMERKDLQSIYAELGLKPHQGQHIFYKMVDKIYNYQVNKDDDLTKLAKEVSDLAEQVCYLWNKKYNKENVEKNEKV